jgi:hypothetical protein
VRDEGYTDDQIPAYGAEAQPAIAARMAPHLRLTKIGTAAAVLALAAAIGAVVTYPQFGPDFPSGRAGQGWTVVVVVCAVLMLAICGFQLWGWLRAMADWRDDRHQSLGWVRKVSWGAHLGSYVVVLVALWACIAGCVAASFAATSSILLFLALLFLLAAQTLAGVQYVREAGPPGTVPAHMRRLIERDRAQTARRA